MVVVLIVAVMATLASPQLIVLMRENRARQAAQQVAQLISTSRMRALGRGSAVIVRYRSATGFTVLESIEGVTAATARGSATCAAQPGLGCLANNWTNPDLSRQVAQLVALSIVSLTVNNQSGVAQTQMDICFTPLGRSFISFDGNPPTAPMVAATTVSVQRVGTSNQPVGLLRNVAVLPSGMARVGL